MAKGELNRGYRVTNEKDEGGPIRAAENPSWRRNNSGAGSTGGRGIFRLVLAHDDGAFSTAGTTFLSHRASDTELVSTNELIV